MRTVCYYCQCHWLTLPLYDEKNDKVPQYDMNCKFGICCSEDRVYLQIGKFQIYQYQVSCIISCTVFTSSNSFTALTFPYTMCLGLWSKSVSIMCELIVILARQKCGHGLANQLVVRPVGLASINISVPRASTQSRKLLWCLRDDLQVNEVERNSSRFFILSCIT